VRLAPTAVALLALAACADLPTSSTPTLDARSLSLGGAPRASYDAILRADFVAGQVIVRYREGADADAVPQRHRGRRKQDLLVERAHLIEVAEGDEASVVASLRSDPDVEFAEMDYLTVLTPCDVGICQNANDSFNNAYKWDLHNTGSIRHNGTGLQQATGKVDADMDWVEAYDALGGDNFTGTATVGILDTGIRPTHQEFTGRIIAARNFATGYPATLIEDRDGHGSHVAGIAAARADGFGTSGVAFGRNIKLINAKVCDLYAFANPTPGGPPIIQASCPTSSQADGIRYATDQGANVINLSLGGSPLPTAVGSPLVRAALQYARSKNVLPVCATGNDNFNGAGFPARFPECFAVGATNWSDGRASYSNYGSRLDISAPGGDGNALGNASSLIMSVGISLTTANPTPGGPPIVTPSNSAYTWKAGTSMATPQVVGLAALLYASGLTTPEAVMARIISTADDLGAPGRDDQFGHGRINVYRALTLKEPGAAPIAVILPPGAAIEGTPVSFDGSTSSDPNNHPITFAWAFGDGMFGTGAAPTHTFIDNGTFAVALTVRDESGRTTTTTSSQTVFNANPTVTLAMPARVMSGGTAAIQAAFGDLGVADSPWSWSIEWGNGRTSGVANAIGAIDASRRYCSMGTAPVRLEVTDKDGGMGWAEAAITVVPHALQVSMPTSFNVKSNGKLPVRIYGSATFDVRRIDVASLTLAGVGAVVKNNGTFQAGYTEGSDGFTDLVVHVSREELARAGLPAGTHQWQVNATLTDGCTLHVGKQELLTN
jgi:serine protease